MISRTVKYSHTRHAKPKSVGMTLARAAHKSNGKRYLGNHKDLPAMLRDMLLFHPPHFRWESGSIRSSLMFTAVTCSYLTGLRFQESQSDQVRVIRAQLMKYISIRINRMRWYNSSFALVDHEQGFFVALDPPKTTATPYTPAPPDVGLAATAAWLHLLELIKPESPCPKRPAIAHPNKSIKPQEVIILLWIHALK